MLMVGHLGVFFTAFLGERQKYDLSIAMHTGLLIQTCWELRLNIPICLDSKPMAYTASLTLRSRSHVRHGTCGTSAECQPGGRTIQL